MMVANVPVLEHPKELLLLLLALTITVNLEQKIVTVVYLRITYLIHYGTLALISTTAKIVAVSKCF